MTGFVDPVTNYFGYGTSAGREAANVFNKNLYGNISPTDPDYINPNILDNTFQTTPSLTDTSNPKTFLGLEGSTWSGIGAGIQGLSGLANAYLGYQALQQAKKQFKFQKGLANRNLANQAKTINNTYDNAAQVAAGMIGGTDSAGNFGFTDPSIVKRYQDRAKEQHVDGSPIG